MPTTTSPGPMSSRDSDPSIDALTQQFPSSTSLASGVSRNSADSTSTMSSGGLPEELPQQVDEEALQVRRGKDEDEEEQDPLVKYAAGLRSYTKTLYTEARKRHEQMEEDRARGGSAGKSGIERMGQKNQVKA